MKVLFIYPDLLDFHPNYPGHYYDGIGSLSAAVKACGHETALIHIIRPITNPKSFTKQVWEHEPDLIAFSATTLQFDIVKKIASWLKRDRPVPKICGGVHPSLMPEKTLLNTDIDMVCIGEGEDALRELCCRIEKKESFHDIPNIWVKNHQEILKNPAFPPESNLDGLPFSDRSVFDYQNLWWERNGTATLMASRGCPFSCTYCCNSALRKIYDKSPSTCRKRSVDRVIKEIQQIQKDYPFITSLNFDDDIFFIDKKWAREFTAQYRKKIKLPFFCNIRPNIVDEEVAHLLKESCCSEIRIGLESGSDEIRNSVLKRKISRKQIVKACRLLQNADISVRTFNIIGFPEENPRMILETIRLNAELEIADPQYTIFYPFPGTELYNKYLLHGFIKSKTMTNYYEESVMNLPELSREHLQMFRIYFHHILKLYRILLKLPTLIRSPLILVIEAIFSSRKTPVTIRKLHLLKNRLRSKPKMTKAIVSSGTTKAQHEII